MMSISMPERKPSSCSREKMSTYILYGLVLLVVGTLIYVIRPYPPDDFLRHVRYTDYKSLGGYSFMFPYSYFNTFRFDPWFGFDLLTGFIQKAIGSDHTVIVYEIAFSCIFIIALLINLKTTKKSTLYSVTIIVIFLFMSYGFYRISLIRPAILISAFLLFGITGKRVFPGFLLATVSGLLYWFFWFYTIPLSLAHYLKGSKKFSYGVIAGTLTALLSWIILTDFQYIKVVANIFAAIVGGRDKIVIGENILSLGRLATPIIFLAVASFVLTVKVRKKIDAVLLLVLFTLPLAIQIRYFLDISLPLMFIYVINNNLNLIDHFYDSVKPTIEAFGIIAMVMIIPPLLDRSIEGQNIYSLKPLNISAGSIVLTDGLPLNFHVVFYNRAPVRVIPCAEIGWNDGETKKVLRRLSEKAAIDDSLCSYLQAYNVNYVVSEKNSVAACLEFDTLLFSSTNKNITLWKVKPFS
jgi:hypothetical protein